MTLRMEIEDQVGIITIARPERRNALDAEMRVQFAEHLHTLSSDAAIRAILIRGEGNTFCAGADLAQFGQQSIPASRNRMARGGLKIVSQIMSADKPVICAVDGAALGLGWSIALASDLVLATPKAFFSMPFARWGMVADCGAAFFLTRMVGPMKAKDILFSSRNIEAEEALQRGFISRIVTDRETINEEALALAHELAAGPTVAFGMMKHLVARSQSPSLDEFLRDEMLISPQMRFTGDFKEGIQSFKEKRPARFKGE